MDRGPPPPGGDQNRGPETLIIVTILTFLAVFAVLFRFLARAVGHTSFGSDDWTMLLALIIAVLNWSLGVVSFYAGYGRHIYYLEWDQIVRIGRLAFIAELLVVLAVSTVKVSVSLFLLRIVGLRKWLKFSLDAVIAFQVVSTVVYTVVLFAQCRPVTANWDPIVRETADCWPSSVLADVSYFQVAVSVFTDCLCVALPIPLIWQLQMSMQRKWSVMILLCLGVFATICGIVRLSNLSALEDLTDGSWDLVPLGDWTVAEYCIGIIAGSIPPCRQLFLQLTARLFARKGADDDMARSRSTGRSSSFAQADAAPSCFGRPLPRHGGWKSKRSKSRSSEHSMTPLQTIAAPGLEEKGVVRRGSSVK